MMGRYYIKIVVRSLSMIHLYQEEIQFLQEKNDKLKKEVQFLKKQLEYKSFGLPNYVRESVHYK
jgi:FtsZ-binding cell division protein ZapB